MVDQNFEVVRLDESVLRSVAKKIIRIAHDELIEWRRRCHQYRARTAAAAAGAARSLPGGGDGSGMTGHYDGVQRADVDAQFQSAGGYHAANFALTQTAFNFAALQWQVPAAIPAHRLRFAGLRRIGLLQISKKDFGLQSGIGKHHGLQIALEKFLRDTRRFAYVAAANAQRAIYYRRIVKHKSFFCGGRAIGVKNLYIIFQKARSQFARIGDGSGTADKLRIASIKTRDAAETTQYIAEVAAENATVGVQLIDDDIAQMFEEASPARVMRQNAGVQHVGIG